MKIFIRTLFMAVPVLLVVLPAHAHDPKEHAAQGEKADCSAMQDMDHSKMDMKDPVMQAMMKKCAGQTNHSDEDDAHRDDKESADAREKHGHKSNAGHYDNNWSGKITLPGEMPMARLNSRMV